MKYSEPYDISCIYKGIIDLNSEDNCVRDYLKEYYPKISKKNISSLGDENGVSPNELYSFCIKYKIKLILYDILGNIIISNYPEIEENSRSYKSIIGIFYNGHFYPLKNKTLEKIKYSDIQTHICSSISIHNLFIKLVNVHKIIPSDIGVNDNDEYGISIGCFTYDNSIYIANDEYSKCEHILNKLGLSDKITPYVRMSNIYKIIEPLFYNGESYCHSFFPIYCDDSGYNWKNNNLKYDNNLLIKMRSIDKNKAWSNSLANLKFLIYCDYRTAKITKCNDIKNLIEYNLYICRPDKPSILMPKQKIYSGEHIIYCKNEGLKFDIIEEIECKSTNNYYKDMINHLYKVFCSCEDQIIVKDIINFMIGKFYKSINLNTKLNVTKIANEQEIEEDEDKTSYVKIEDDLYIKIDNEIVLKDIYNKRPIRNQIIDFSNRMMYEKINQLKLTNDNIVQIHIDEITFINNGEYEKIKDELNPNEWTKWKESNIKELSYYDTDNKNIVNDIPNISFYNYDIPKITSNTSNYLYDCYAGSGKTYKIINEIIPKIISSHKINDKHYTNDLDDGKILYHCDPNYIPDNDYIVYTPSHNSLKSYRKKQYKCDVIQIHSYSTNRFPKENNIIIDEFGLCDKKAHDFIFKCFILRKNIISFGDFKQLLPAEGLGHYNSDQYIKMIFGNVIDMSSNYRNNYTKEYYDKLISQEIDICLEMKVHLQKVKFNEADIILCRTNDECDKYNEIMLKLKDISFGDIGCKIICNSNLLRNKDIYNSFIYNIIDVNDDIITLDDSISTITISKDQLNKNFKPAYALTFYKSQGQEFDSVYVPNSSINKYVDGRTAYTLISRIKEQKIKQNDDKKQKINNKLILKF